MHSQLNLKCHMVMMVALVHSASHVSIFPTVWVLADSLMCPIPVTMYSGMTEGNDLVPGDHRRQMRMHGCAWMGLLSWLNISLQTF